MMQKKIYFHSGCYLLFFMAVLFLLFLPCTVSAHRHGENHKHHTAALLEQAMHGNCDAMCDLGLAYYEGNGVLKDPVQAKCWVKRAWEHGSKRAQGIWNELELWKYAGKCEFEQPQLQMAKNKPGQVKWVQGIPLVWVPGGCFDMGDGDNKFSSSRVCLGGFWMGKFEVTQEQWKSVMGGGNPSRFRNGGNYPVEQVSFSDALAFIGKLNQKHGGFSLPTEAQWEYVCQNREKDTPYPFGKERFRPKANCGACNAGQFQGRTAPVGSFPPNSLGIYDMGGNVAEWCREKDGNDTGQSNESDDSVWENENGQAIVRGGGFDSSVPELRCAARREMLDSIKSPAIGFRIVQNLP